MIPTELLEQLAKSDAFCEASRVLFAVFRMTLGYRKKSDRIAQTQLAALTGLLSQNVNRGLGKIVKTGIVTKSGKPHKIQTIGFDYLDNQGRESGQSKLSNTKDSSSKYISPTEGGLENDLRQEIEKWLKKCDIGNPEAYLDKLVRECNKDFKALKKAWGELIRGACEESPTGFYARALHYAGRSQKHLK